MIETLLTKNVNTIMKTFTDVLETSEDPQEIASEFVRHYRNEPRLDWLYEQYYLYEEAPKLIDKILWALRYDDTQIVINGVNITASVLEKLKDCKEDIYEPDEDEDDSDEE